MSSKHRSVEHYRREVLKRLGDRRAHLYVEDIDPREVWDSQHGICGLCHEPIKTRKYQLDHIVALALGGLHTRSNIQVVHAKCNTEKGQRENIAAKKRRRWHAVLIDTELQEQRFRLLWPLLT